MSVRKDLKKMQENTIKAVEAISDNKYRDTVFQADNFYISKNMDQAKVMYQKALDIKPDESYPKEMLDKISENEGKQKVLVKRQDYNYLKDALRSISNLDIEILKMDRQLDDLKKEKLNPPEGRKLPQIEYEIEVTKAMLKGHKHSKNTIIEDLYYKFSARDIPEILNEISDRDKVYSGWFKDNFKLNP